MNSILTGRGIVGLGIVAFISVFFVKHYIDIAMNYQQVQGKISSVIVDCSVERGKEYLMDKETKQIAYMPCETATSAAVSAHFDPADVRRNIKVQISYISPINNSTQVAKYNQYNTDAVYSVGDVFKIYASVNDPKVYSTW